MSERVESLDLGVEWEPNAPEAVVCSSDLGRAALALAAHPHDADQRTVVLVWSGVLALSVTPYNDESRRFHPLYGYGLRGLLWAGVVIESTWIAEIAPAVDNASDVLHYVLPLKELTIDIAARGVAVSRSDLDRPTAVASTLERRTDRRSREAERTA